VKKNWETEGETKAMKRKKILHLVEAFGGGVYTYLLGLSNRISNEYDVVIAYSKRSQTPDNFQDEFDKHIKFIEVKNFHRNIGMQDFKAVNEVKEIIKKEKPDIVHLHSSKAGVIGRMAIKDRNIKLFYTPHGYSFFKKDDSKIKRTMYKSIEKMAALYNKNCTTIACSEGEYNCAKRISTNCKYVNNGINTEYIDECLMTKKINNKASKLRIGSIGRIDTQKNPKLFNEIAGRFPDIEFVWIGDGEQRNLLDSKNIEITGWIKNEEVISKMADCDVFLLPSLWEGLPMSLLEAMYMGKICVTSNISGNNNVIKSGINGFICEELEDYCDIISKIKNNKVNTEDIIKNAKISIMTEYNLDVMSNKYKDIYKQYVI